MNHANQQVVNQNANITLINIRQAEISYFSTFYTSFGTQCFLLAGILAGSISQTPGFECATNCVFFWQLLYNASAALCLALTCLVLIATVFISVFGQGLAIRGPPGSMVHTVEGMIAEQRSIVFLFSLVVASYMVQLVGMYFIVMDWEWATVCAVLTGLGSYWTYFCSVRIYNRFKFDEKKSGWDFDKDDDEEKELSELSPEVLQEVLQTTNNPLVNSAKVKSLYQDSVQKGLIHENDSNEKKKNVLLLMMKKFSVPQKTAATQKRGSSAQPATGTAGGDHFEDVAARSNSPYREMEDNNKNNEDELASHFDYGSSTTGGAKSGRRIDATHVGYLTVKVANPRASVIGVVKEKWIRYFFVLKGHHVYYYVDRKAFEKNASKPINSRPIELEGYLLQPTTPEPPYAFSLVPAEADDIRKVWKFRCDTVSEMTTWIEILQKAIPPPNSTD